MQAYWTLVRRELGTHFLSWTGYIVIAAVLFLLGCSFQNLILALNKEPTIRPITELFYGTIYFWLILLIASPVITMRSFAHEKSVGTFETLMTTPVSDLQVVLAKFTAAMCFYILLWLPLLGCLFTLRYYSHDNSIFDSGTIVSTFVGIFLLGSMYMAMGCFASSVTKSQIIAAIISLVFGISLFLLSFAAMIFSTQTGWKAQLFNQVDLIEQMQDFARGVIDTRPVVLYLSFTVFFLFLTLKSVESRRWK
ncbi:MAG: nosY [Verrucomicrobiales bacterium]|nr:nosY [Verrucomicrobiales bacterium]